LMTGEDRTDVVAFQNAVAARSAFATKKYRLVQDAGTLVRECLFGEVLRAAAVATPVLGRLLVDRAGLEAVRDAVGALEHSMRELDLDETTASPQVIELTAIDVAGKAFIGKLACLSCICNCVQLIALMAWCCECRQNASVWKPAITLAASRQYSVPMAWFSCVRHGFAGRIRRHDDNHQRVANRTGNERVRRTFVSSCSSRNQSDAACVAIAKQREREGGSSSSSTSTSSSSCASRIPNRS
jgi:hypothetical protein